MTGYAAIFATAAMLVTPAFAGGTASQSVDIDLTFAYHLDAEMAEQDVFVERVPGSGEVFRVTGNDPGLAERPIYASAEPQDHAPFDIEAVGPYPRGAALGMSLAEWLGARGSGRYRCVDGEATIDVDFHGLAPNGVYTMWHFFMTPAPTEPFIGTYDLPIGSLDGSDSVFAADARGRASFRRSFAPCLQLSGEQLMSGLAIAWHSDGRTYGVDPGRFGLNSHVQMFLGLPKRAGL